MSDQPRLAPLDALDRAQAAAATVIVGLGEDDWARPTPCDEWSVRDVVNKMVASTGLFAAFGRRERPRPMPDLVHPAELIGDDPLGAFLEVAAECRAAWRRPGALDGEAPSTVGEYPAVAVLNARIFDTTILTWDVAVATGRASLYGEVVDDRLAAYVLRVARAIVGNVRRVSPDRYKDPTDPGEDAPLIERMIAATGRDPSWQP